MQAVEERPPVLRRQAELKAFLVENRAAAIQVGAVPALCSIPLAS